MPAERYQRLRIETTEVQQIVDRFLQDRAGARILDAGCGYSSFLDFGSTSSVDGVDLSAEQLARNKGLCGRMCTDIQELQLSPAQYDAIVCWDLLEHLRYPERVLSSFARWVKPGGLIILAMPNVMSAPSVAAKLTPHSLHVWTYRRLLGDKLAGQDGHGPFPTYMRRTISPWNIRRWASANNLTALKSSIFDPGGIDHILMEKHRLLAATFKAFSSTLQFLSFGHISSSRSKCLFVFQKSTVVCNAGNE